MKTTRINVLIIFIILVLNCGSKCKVEAQNSVLAFGQGETLHYLVSYRWGPLWVDAGEISFYAEQRNDAESSHWFFRSTGSSLKRFDWLFKVRDTFEVKTGFEPFEAERFYRHTSEGGHRTVNDFQFYRDKGLVQMKIVESDKKDFDSLMAMPNDLYDVLTATYLVRSKNFSRILPGEGFHLKVLMDRQIEVLPIRYIGKKAITTPSGLSFNCIGFYTGLKESSLFDPDEKIRVWVTDDANKIPVLIEAKIKIGRVEVYLQSFENMAHELSSFKPLIKP